ncbi:MAG: transcription termination/antitermination factor NusG [Clostridiales bacterium]|nr:transcription termination/antitermination factor NusG [Clostridiales bacterium]
MSEQLEAKWYVIHTYSGYEKKVKTTLDKMVENRGLQEMIQEVQVPTEDVIEVKDGKKKVVQRKKFPGYVFVKMVYNEEIWYIVRNTRGVTGFVGPNANRPLPLTEEDLVTMGLATDWVPSVDYEVGDTVRIISGPFIDSICKVEAIDMEKQQVTVRISMFGRETPVSVDFAQVIRI